VTEGRAAVFEPEPGIRLHFDVAGDGERTLIVANAAMLPDLEPLAVGRRLVVLHQRGRGASDRVADPERLGLAQEAADIVALADHLGIGTFALMGWSYVGFVAALCAAEHPARVDRLVLMCPAPPYHDPAWPAPPPPPPEIAAELRRLHEPLPGPDDGEARCREFQRLHRLWRMGDPTAVDRSRADPCRHENEWPDRTAGTFQAVWRTREGIELRSRLPSIAAPTLVVHGDEDLIPLEGSEAYARLVPSGRLLRLPGVGHYPHLERPDVLFPAVDAFLH
jgi:pimeloyl-ACP methyl ester carboxylesterase